ncbi:type IV toxin-antitoxin system AbiEi family antitoxin domain-containing protein [Solirubrobacter ginsenosidimutans]|nr:type IV toxin-antitoxin system AbiEi family antitoxin domain-containing protein [Solirubrobacter ginsenosidimutans]
MIHERSDRPHKRGAPLLAAHQHGAIRASQLGLPRSTIADWVRAGRLYRKYRGVYAYGHPNLSREGEWMAAILAAGDRSALTGLCGAVLMRLTKREPDEIDVVAPGHRRPQAGFRLRTCRNLDPCDITIVNRIPVTTIPRMLIDLSDDGEDADELANLIHEAAYLKIFSLKATRAAIDRSNGRHNLDVLEEALRLHLSGSAGTRTRLEKRFKRLVRGAGLPTPQTNTIVNGFEVDAYWPGLCVEIDGPNHRRARTKTDDRIRDAALRAAGYTVIRFTEDDVETHPDKILADLIEHL